MTNNNDVIKTASSPKSAHEKVNHLSFSFFHIPKTKEKFCIFNAVIIIIKKHSTDPNRFQKIKRTQSFPDS